MEVILFYLSAAVTLLATLWAITRRNAVHAVVYLAASFFALALIFYLLGAPALAAFEVIIYAGAIMVLFLFVIMVLDLGHPERMGAPGPAQWWPAGILFAVILCSLLVLLGTRAAAPAGGFAGIPVRRFAADLFNRFGVALEMVSLQLLFALVGALYLGRRR